MCAAIGFVALLVPTLVAAAPTSVAPLPAAGLQKATRVPAAGGGGWTAQSVLRKPFAPTSPWNTPIPPGARFTPTATFAGDPGWMTSEKNSNPVYVAKPTDPILTFNVVRPNITRVFQVRGPADLTPAASQDLNLTIVDLGANHVWDFFRVVRTGPTTFQAEAFGDTDLDGTGFGSFPPGGGARVRAGVKASGASWLGGLVTGREPGHPAASTTRWPSTSATTTSTPPSCHPPWSSTATERPPTGERCPWGPASASLRAPPRHPVCHRSAP